MKEKPKNRWYDKDPAILRSVNLLETFPVEMQTIVSEGVIVLAERECDAQELMSSLRSLGPETVLALFKSKNMRRAYDENQTMHKAMNYFFILSEENRRFMADRIHDMLDFVADYLRLCHDYQQTPSTENLSEVIGRYIESGSEEAERLLRSLEEKFRRELQKAPVMTMEILHENDRGFRIQNDRI